MSNIRDVAKKANVSIATVSRVLSNDETFHTTSKTKKAIFKAIKDLNYVPNRKIKSIDVGCILSIASEKYADPFFTNILSACEEEAKKYNLNITQVKHFFELSNPITLQNFVHSNLKAVIIMEKIPENIINILKNYIPYIIYVDYDESYELVNSVCFDHRYADLSVFNYLLNAGYKRIAIIEESSVITSVYDSVRVLTYRDVLRRNNIEYDENLVRDCKGDIDECIRQTQKLMKLDTPPEVIFVSGDTLAVETLNELVRLGYKVPEEVGVVGYNNLPISEHSNPPLTTVEIPMKEIGKKTIKRLVEIMRGDDAYPQKISLPTKLIIRESTRKKN